MSEQLQGREAVAAWACSGKTLQAYCDETGQSYWSLRRWRLKFGEELGVAPRRRACVGNTDAPKAAAKLVPIEVSGLRAPASTIEIRLRGERTVVIGTDIESAALTRLVGAIERAT